VCSITSVSIVPKITPLITQWTHKESFSGSVADILTVIRTRIQVLAIEFVALQLNLSILRLNSSHWQLNVSLCLMNSSLWLLNLSLWQLNSSLWQKIPRCGKKFLITRLNMKARCRSCLFNCSKQLFIR